MLSGKRPFSLQNAQQQPRVLRPIMEADGLMGDGEDGGADGNVIVRVRAQVMTRDDSKGGWVPKGKGGFANVSVRKKKIQHEDSHCRYEYQIYGKSGNEDSKEETVLNCAIKKDFVYHKVMPAFHHWQSDAVKLGLTFQTASDARTFDKGIQLAMGDLFEEKSLACPHKRIREFKDQGLSESPTPHQFNVVGDDDVFMQLDLPVDKGDSGPRRSPSSPLSPPPPPRLLNDDSTVRSPPPPPGSGDNSVAGESSKQRLDREIRLLLRTIDSAEDDPFKKMQQQQQDEDDKESSYVKFPPRPLVHEYSYPTLFDSNKSSTSKIGSRVFGGCNKQQTQKSFRSTMASPQLPVRQSSSGGFLEGGKSWLFGGSNSTSTSSNSPPEAKGAEKQRRRRLGLLSPSPPQQQRKRFSLSPSGDPVDPDSSGSQLEASLFGGGGGRPHCVHCRESFTLSDNPRGACEEAPDRLRRGIELVTGVRCADGLLYHCAADSEGDYPHHPCECGEGHCSARRWFGMTLLSFLLPCLCCYPPLIACYRCGRACGACGGRHQAVA